MSCPLLLATLAVMFGLVDGFFLSAINTAPVPGATSNDHPGRRGEDDRGPGRRVRRRTPGQLAAGRGERRCGVLGQRLAVRGVGRLLGRYPDVLPQDAAGQAAAPPNPEPSSNKSEVSVWADPVAGIRLIRGYRTLTTLLIVVFVAELGFSGPMIAGVPLLANETGWGVRTVGWVLGGFGLGAAAAAGFLLWRKNSAALGSPPYPADRDGPQRLGTRGAAGIGTISVDSVPCRWSPWPHFGHRRGVLRHADQPAVLQLLRPVRSAGSWVRCPSRVWPRSPLPTLSPGC